MTARIAWGNPPVAGSSGSLDNTVAPEWLPMGVIGNTVGEVQWHVSVSPGTNWSLAPLVVSTGAFNERQVFLNVGNDAGFGARYADVITVTASDDNGLLLGTLVVTVATSSDYGAISWGEEGGAADFWTDFIHTRETP